MSSYLMSLLKITKLFTLACIRDIIFTFILCMTVQESNASILSVIELFIFFISTYLCLLFIDKNTYFKKLMCSLV